jgi:U32 family peptidase
LDEAIIEIGFIRHFFSKINVAIIELSLPLSVGDHILVKGPLTDFDQKVESMQIDHKEIHRAEGGQSVGLKLGQLAKEKDVVYKNL